MGSMIEYECDECGYKTAMFSGVSGIGLKYNIPFFCEKTKDIVMVSGDREKDDGPGEHPPCPKCKNHKLKEKWDYNFCPKCHKNNQYEVVGMWD